VKREAPPPIRPVVWQARRFGSLLGLALMLLGGGGLLLLAVYHPTLIPPPLGALFRCIVIDAGHGGSDRGASGNSLTEKTLTLDVAKELKALLRAQGFFVVMTREDDSFPTLAARVRVGAEQTQSAVFISIHFNYANNASASGIETYFYDPTPANSGETPTDPVILESERLAANIQLAMIEATEATNRGIKNRGFYVLRNASIPAVLVEGGFVTNPADAALLQVPAYRKRLAKGIHTGLMEYRSEMRRLRRESAEKSPAIE